MISRILVLLAITFIFIGVINADGMIEVFSWKQMDFYNRGDNRNVENIPNKDRGSYTKIKHIDRIIFPGNTNAYRPQKRAGPVITSRDDPINTESRASFNENANASYIPYNNVPMGVTHYNGRLFITMPRRRIGIPSTLNFIDLVKDGNNPSPKLYAFPDFETNYLPPSLEASPNRLVSVYRTTVDACNRLWFIDTGMLEYPDNRLQIKRPTIWIIDLKTNQVLHRYEIPQDIVDTGRGLASVEIDVNPINCGKAYAYIPDLVNNQLFVYSLNENRIWAFSHNYFNFDPLGGDLSIGGQQFRWDDGIFSVTLGPYLPNGYRKLFFHAMASNNEFVVSNQVLQNETNAQRSDHGNDFQILGSRGEKKQSTMHMYDPRTGAIFYDEIQRNGVGCWNTKTPFSAQNHGTVIEDAQRMIYPSDLTIDNDGTIWVMSNSMPIFIYSNLDPNIVNFRVWKQNVFTAVQNTVCQ